MEDHRRLVTGILWLTLAFHLFVGLFGAFIVERHGVPAAMWLAMLGGNLEPSTPEVAFPWGILLTLVACALVGLGLEVRARAKGDRRRAVVAVGLAQTAAGVAALVPFYQVLRLFLAI